MMADIVLLLALVRPAVAVDPLAALLVGLALVVVAVIGAAAGRGRGKR